MDDRAEYGRVDAEGWREKDQTDAGEDATCDRGGGEWMEQRDGMTCAEKVQGRTPDERGGQKRGKIKPRRALPCPAT